MMEKQRLRAYITARAHQYRSEDFLLEDQQTCVALLKSTWYHKAAVLFAFMPLESEVNIVPLLTDAVAKKQLALPIAHRDNTLTFHLVEDLATLSRGSYGLLEPQEGTILTPSETDLIIVPALAYTRAGVRLGRGKGFYDRYLATYTKTPTVGVCRSYQLLDTIAEQRLDRRVDQVLVAGSWY